MNLYFNLTKFERSPSMFKQIKFLTSHCDTLSNIEILEISQIVDRIDIFSKLTKLLENDHIMAIYIEAGIFEFSLSYALTRDYPFEMINSIHNSKSHDIMCNLDKTSSVHNTYLLPALKNGIIDPQTIAFLTPIQLFPSAWEIEITRKQFKEYKKNNMATTDIYKCYKCDARKTKIIQMQLRSPDEPMTTIVTCQVCYNVWKF